MFLKFVVYVDGSEDGAFLVRESNTAVGDYVLSVLHEGEVVHYQIRRHGEDAFFSIGKFNFINNWGGIMTY
jgi:tyrosine-protein kinase